MVFVFTLKTKDNYLYISTFHELNDFISRAKKDTLLAIDTEFIREKSYYPKLCLLQLGTSSEQVAIDPLALEDMSPLIDLFVDQNIVKIFHASTQDLEIIEQEFGIMPSPIFDTQVAAGFLGYPVQMGYQAIVEAFCGITLPKTQSLTDWSKRPLDEQQLSYALDDVKYLPDIYSQMIEALKAKGRLEWVLPEMKDLLDKDHYSHNPHDAFKKVKRISSLNRRQLGIAREIAAWREEESQKRNHPRRWILSDEIVVELAKRAPLNKKELLKIRNTDSLSVQNQAKVLSAIQKGLSLSKEELPQLPRRHKVSKEVESVIDLMNALLKFVADKQEIAPALLASKDDLVNFYFDSQSSPLAIGWRHELVGNKLLELLSGSIGLTVEDSKIEILHK